MEKEGRMNPVVIRILLAHHDAEEGSGPVEKRLTQDRGVVG